MESKFSDQELHDVALGYKPSATKVQNLCGELLAARQEITKLREKWHSGDSAIIEVHFEDGMVCMTGVNIHDLIVSALTDAKIEQWRIVEDA